MISSWGAWKKIPQDSGSSKSSISSLTLEILFISLSLDSLRNADLASRMRWFNCRNREGQLQLGKLNLLAENLEKVTILFGGINGKTERAPRRRGQTLPAHSDARNCLLLDLLNWLRPRWWKRLTFHSGPGNKVVITIRHKYWFQWKYVDQGWILFTL